MCILAKLAFLSFLAVTVADKGFNGEYVTCGQQNSLWALEAGNMSVSRLMELRHPDWGWSNTPEVVLGLQLSAQNMFFGRQEALDRMETEINETIGSMNIGKLALYVTAIQASCENPRDFGGRNLVAVLARRITKQFRYNGSAQIVPYDGYYRFGLALGALCVNHEFTPPWVIRKLLRCKNKDGSFGKAHSVDDSAQLLLALTCVESECRRRFFKRVVGKAAEDLVEFLESKITTDDDGWRVWIGNKYSSPSSALALMEASDDSPEDWQCEMIMDSLADSTDSSEPEGAYSQRLPSLSGISYLDLKFTDWKCAPPVPVPPGYQPTCDPANPPTCDPVLPTTGPSNAVTTTRPLIEVRLTIFTEKPPEVGTIPNADAVTIIGEGSTLLTAMTQAQNEGKISFQTTPSSWGEYVTSMQGVAADAEAHEYWSLINGVSGDPLPQGVSSYVPADGEQTVFRLKTW